MASSMARWSACPVSMIRCASGMRCFTWARKSAPFMPGSRKSEMTTSGLYCSRILESLLPVEGGANLPGPAAEHATERLEDVLLVVHHEQPALGGRHLERRLHRVWSSGNSLCATAGPPVWSAEPVGIRSVSPGDPLRGPWVTPHPSGVWRSSATQAAQAKRRWPGVPGGQESPVPRGQGAQAGVRQAHPVAALALGAGEAPVGRAISSSAVCTFTAGWLPTPTLAVSRRSAAGPVRREATSRRIRSATVSAPARCVCGRRQANSSSPVRATVSGSRTAATRHWADRAEHAVFNEVAERLVDAAELVEVHQDEGERIVVALRAPEFVLEPQEEVAAVVHLGEGVHHRDPVLCAGVF